MKALIPFILGLLALAVLPGAARAADVEGCVDLKPLPRLEGCVIQECSAKQHEPFETSDSSAGPLDANVNSLTYTCPASMDVQRVKRELEAEIRKAGYQNTAADKNIADDKTDPANFSAIARKGSHWLRWSVSSEDAAAAYTLTSAENASEKFKAEACGQAPVVSPFKQCEIVECTSKSEDSVAMRTAQKQATSLTGNVQTLTLACPSISASQAFTTVETELRTSGFEILFSDREHPENGWMTGRAGKKWVELVSAPDGESVSYALTVVPSAEVLTAAKPEPSPVPVAALTPAVAPVPTPAPEPVTVPKPMPVTAPNPTSPSVAANSIIAGFVPPKPILEAPIDAPTDWFHKITGEVAINLLVDVSANGSVTGAVLTGRVTRDVLKLQSAAIDAVFKWRFEPARQDGRVVPALKFPLQLHFDGRPAKSEPSAIAGVSATPVPPPVTTFDCPRLSPLRRLQKRHRRPGLLHRDQFSKFRLNPLTTESTASRERL